METIQILMILFGLFALTRVILRLKDKHIKMTEFIFWSIIWILVIVVAFIPSITANLAELLGIASGISLLVYISILILFYLVFRIYVRIEGQSREITEITRKIALKNSPIKKESTKETAKGKTK
jgi:small membrane protein